jgi:ABC-2 type transport system permease protein
VSASTRSVIGAVAWRSLHRMYTNPALLLPSLIFPLFFFTAFAGGLSAISNVPGFDFPSGYTAFQFVFVMLQASAFGGVFTGFGIAADFESGFARRMMLAAPNRLGIVAGYSLAALVRALITMAILFTVALIAGMQIGGDGVDLGGLVLLAVLVNLSAGLFACGVATRLRTIQAGPLMQIPVFLILFTAPVFVPLNLLNGWISAVAPFNPVTRLLETGRGFIAGEPTVVLGAFAIGLGLAAVFCLWAVRGMRSAERAA